MRLDFSEERLGRIFPAFLLIDIDLTLLAVGPSIRLQDPAILTGQHLFDHFRLLGGLERLNLMQLVESGGTIQLGSTSGRIVVSGSVIDVEDDFLLAMNNVFAPCSVEPCDLRVSDFGPCDPTVQGLMLVQMQQAMIQDAQSMAFELACERHRSLELLQRVRRLAGYVAHDFDNFLSIIRLNSDRLLKSSPISQTQRRLSGLIIETAERASGITRSLMALSQQQTDSRVQVYLDQLIADNHTFFSTVAGLHVMVECKLGADGVTIEISLSGLLNCLINLLLNARDAMLNGGSITIETLARAVPVAQPGGTEDARSSPHVVVRVSDTGSGMTEDVQARAFEPLYSTKSHGSGMGLASVLEFAREMGGDAIIDSSPGEGTSVEIILPICQVGKSIRSIENKLHSDTKHEIPTEAARILLVEDEPYALEALAEMLEGEGYVVTAVSNAVEAMAAIETLPHQLLLSDIILPDMRGLELATWACNCQPGLRVILMSGFVPDGGDLRREWKFVRKPLDIGILLELLQSEMRGRRLISTDPEAC